MSPSQIHDMMVCIICNNTDGTTGYFIDWNKPGREKQNVYILSKTWKLRKVSFIEQKRSVGTREREIGVGRG